MSHRVVAIYAGTGAVIEVGHDERITRHPDTQWRSGHVSRIFFQSPRPVTATARATVDPVGTILGFVIEAMPAIEQAPELLVWGEWHLSCLKAGQPVMIKKPESSSDWR